LPICLGGLRADDAAIAGAGLTIQPARHKNHSFEIHEIEILFTFWLEVVKG
jgi:hypothetical protein